MTAHKRRHTTQPFALCKLSYTVLGWDTYQHVNMIFACLCLYYFYPLVLTQFPQHLPYILFDLSIYHLSTVFRSKYDMIKSY